MQPGAFRKFRTLSPVALCFCGLVASTILIGGYKYYYIPWSTKRHLRRTEQFADEYFEKHKIQNVSDEI